MSDASYYVPIDMPADDLGNPAGTYWSKTDCQREDVRSKRTDARYFTCVICRRLVDATDDYAFDWSDDSVAHASCASFAVEYINIDVPSGAYILHGCGFADCINPEHLVLVQPAEES